MVDPELAAHDAADEIDPWAWAHHEDAEAPVDLGAQSVVAVLIARDAEPWVERSLAALAAQRLRPDRILGVDAASNDATRARLEQARAAGTLDEVLTVPAEGFGAAVAAALESVPSAPEQWLWLLHDDAEPGPDALAAALTVGVVDGAGIVVPKLLQARRHGAKTIAEAGVAISATGARVLRLDEGDVDQGQLDVEPVLGASSCGLLVRRDVWDRLGGFDPSLPLFRDGAEFCWRATSAGESVLLAPQAEFVHRQVGRAGLRTGIDHPTALDRRYGMIAAAAHRRGIGGWLANVGMVLAVLAGALGFLLAKAPSRAADQLRAVGGYLGSGRQTRQARRRVFASATSADGRRRARALRPGVRHGGLAILRSAAGAVGDRWDEAFGGAGDGNLDELIGEDFAGSARPEGGRRRPWLLPTIVAWCVVVVLALVAARRLLHSGSLTSLALAPAPSTLDALYRTYAGVIPGTHQVGPAWTGWALIASTLTFGQPEWFVTLLVVGAVPLAMIPSYLFLRTVTNDRRVQLVGSALAATAPALVGATARGALGTLALALLLPALGLAIRNWQRRGTHGYESWRGPILVGLLLAIWAAFQPLAWLLALVAGLVVAVAARSLAQALRIALALVIPVVLGAPWLPALVAHPGRLLTGEDPTLLPPASSAAPLLVIGRSAGGGLPPLWLSLAVVAALWVLTLIGVVLRPRSAVGFAGLAVGGLALASVAAHLVVPVAGAAQVRPTALPWLLVMIDALICAAAIGFDHLGARLAATSFGLAQVLALVALVLGTAITLVSIGWWVVGGLGAPLQRAGDGLPSYVRAVTVAPQTGRVLVVDATTDQPRYNLVEQSSASLGGPDRGGAGGGDPAVAELTRETVAELIAGRADEVVSTHLAQLGVRYVVVRGAGQELAASIGSVPRLQSASNDDQGRVWRVTDGPSAAAVGPSPSTRGPGPAWWALAELVLLVALVILATPSLRRGQSRDPEGYARRSAGGRRAIEGDE